MAEYVSSKSTFDLGKEKKSVVNSDLSEEMPIYKTATVIDFEKC